MRAKWIGLGVAAAVAAVLAILVFRKPAGADGARDFFVYGRTRDSITLDPAETQSGEDAKIEENLFEGLISFKDQSTELEGRLATKWTPSEDGKTWTLELRNGVRFHDGTPFDADAVVFTFGRLLDPNHPYAPKATPYRGTIGAVIDRVEAKDPHTVVFHLKGASPLFLTFLATFSTGIVSPTAVKACHGKTEGFSQKPVGTGPYRLVQWLKDQKIVLDRFDQYWGPKAFIKRAIIVPAKDVQVAIQQLKHGEIHVLDNIGPRDIDPIQRDPQLYVARERPTNTCYLAFNMKLAPYNDVNFRRAVAHAINRRRLIENAYDGKATDAVSIVPRAILEPAPDLPRYDYDVAKAKALCPGGGEVVLWQPDIVRQYMPDTERIIVNLRDDLEKMGLKVKIEKYEWGAYLDKMAKPDHPMGILGWMADYPDAHTYMYSLLHGKAGDDLNVSFFNDPEYDRLIDESNWETDPVKRRELFRKAETLLLEQVPIIPLAHADQLFAVRKEIDYDPHPIEYRLYTVKFK